MPKKLLKKDYVNIIEEHLAKQGKRLTNLSKATIPKLKEIIEKYDIKYDEEKIIQEKIKEEEEEVKLDFTDFEIGEIVFLFTKYKVGDREIEVVVKCMIKKINKCSLTLAKYVAKIDFTDEMRALREQTFGLIKFKWTDELRDKDTVVVKNVERIIRSDCILYKDYLKETYNSVDYGD